MKTFKEFVSELEKPVEESILGTVIGGVAIGAAPHIKKALTKLGEIKDLRDTKRKLQGLPDAPVSKKEFSDMLKNPGKYKRLVKATDIMMKKATDEFDKKLSTKSEKNNENVKEDFRGEKRAVINAIRSLNKKSRNADYSDTERERFRKDKEAEKERLKTHYQSEQLVTDKKTGKKYNPEKEFDKIMNDPETVAQFKRMKSEKGKGWPRRQK